MLLEARHAVAPCGLAATLLLATAAFAQGTPARPVTVPQGGDAARAKTEMLRFIHLPPGFHIALYALVPSARAIAIDPTSKEVFVGTRRDVVWEISGNGHGAVSRVAAFAPQLGFEDPNGVCFAKDGTMFVVERNRVMRFDPVDGADAQEHDVVPEGQYVPPAGAKIIGGARVCRVGPDNKLYIATGVPSNVMPKQEYALFDKSGIGAIDRIDFDGSHREVYAYGIRNSVGLDFNPSDRTLWFTDTAVEGMGDTIPPGELNRATRAGENFGYPWYGGGHVRTELWKDTTPPADVVFPQIETAAHATDLGMSFYTGTMFPAHYRGGIFSTQHGSWDRSVSIGARIMFTSLKPDGGANTMSVFADGWLAPDHSYRGRPVDVQQMKDGSLLVSDDYGGAVYRITYDGR